MKKVTIVLLAMLTFNCAPESKTAYVQVDNGKLTALENALQINVQNDALLAARVLALENLTAQQQQNLLQINNLQQQLQQASQQNSDAINLEIQNRITADANLQSQITALNAQLPALQNTINNYVQQQISIVVNNNNGSNATMLALQQSLSNLTNTVNSLSNSSVTQAQLEAYKLYVNNTYATIAMHNALTNTVNNLATQVNLLSGNVTNLTNLVSGNTVSMVKAPCTSAKEQLLKVNGKYYAAMNIFGQCNELNMVYLAELAVNTTYTTTDGTACKFKVTSSGTLQAL